VLYDYHHRLAVTKYEIWEEVCVHGCMVQCSAILA